MTPNKSEYTHNTLPKSHITRMMRRNGLAEHTEQRTFHYRGEQVITTTTTRVHYDRAWNATTGEPLASYSASEHILCITPALNSDK
jgi:hypothetical protein